MYRRYRNSTYARYARDGDINPTLILLPWLAHFANSNMLSLSRQAHLRLRPTVQLVAVWYLTVIVIGFSLFLSFTFVCSTKSCFGHGDDGGQLIRRWGGFSERPLDDRCYHQERTAMLLSIFLGVFGVDQWYAHHWVLAVFKTLTLGMSGIWALVDVILWIMGGVYGTPGCPGGSGWRY